MADLRGLLDHATREVTLAVASVFGRRLSPREVDAVRESLAALIRLMADMPKPAPPLPVDPPPQPRERERRHARWIDHSLMTTLRAHRYAKRLPPPPPATKKRK